MDLSTLVIALSLLATGLATEELECSYTTNLNKKITGCPTGQYCDTTTGICQTSCLASPNCPQDTYCTKVMRDLCPSDQTCSKITNKCEPTPQTCIPDTNPCKENQFCNMETRICEPSCLSKPVCKSGGVCPLYIIDTCQTSGMKCNEATNKCEPKPTPCSTQMTCGANQFCNMETKMCDPSCLLKPVCKPGMFCPLFIVDTCQQSGLKCNEVTNKCEPLPTPCSTPEQCKTNQFCNLETRICEAKCLISPECPVGMACAQVMKDTCQPKGKKCNTVTNKCEPITCTPGGDPRQCPLDSQCSTVTRKCEPSCLVPNRCEEGMMCIQVMVDRCPKDNECNTKTNRCEPKAITCMTAGYVGCPRGQECNQATATCETPPKICPCPKNRACFAAVYCKNGEECNLEEGQCYTPQPDYGSSNSILSRIITALLKLLAGYN